MQPKDALPAHVKQGALFVFYRPYLNVGRRVQPEVRTYPSTVLGVLLNPITELCNV